MAHRISTASLTAIGLALTLAACGGGSDDSAPRSAASSAAGPVTGGQAGGAISQSGVVEVPRFDAIAVSDGMDVELTVTPGAEQSVEVSVPDDFTGTVATNVSGSRLAVSLSGDGIITGRAVVRISVPTLTSVSTEDGAQLTGTGETDSYEAVTSGGSQVQLSELKAKTVRITLTDGSQATVYASEAITASAEDGSELTIVGSPASRDISTDAGASVSIQ